MCENCPDAHQRQAIREAIVRSFTLWMDTEAWINKAIHVEVEASFTWDMCTGGRLGTEGHDCCEPDDPCCGMDDWPSLRDVGDVVVAWIMAHIVGDEERLQTKIFLELADLGNSSIIEAFGEHYYPDAELRALCDAGIVD